MNPYSMEYLRRKVVIYARVSTEHEAQLSALENQIDWYKPILDYHPEWELVGQYIDEGITGTSAEKRPEFMRMMPAFFISFYYICHFIPSVQCEQAAFLFFDFGCTEGVDLLPSNIELSGMETGLFNVMSREYVLKNAIDSMKKNYDYILIDCIRKKVGLQTVTKETKNTNAEGRDFVRKSSPFGAGNQPEIKC